VTFKLPSFKFDIEAKHPITMYGRYRIPKLPSRYDPRSVV